MCVGLYRVSNIWHLLLYQRLQKHAEFVKLSVGWIAKPCENLYAVRGLSFEIVANIINYNCLALIPPNFAQVFDINSIIKLTVVSVQPMRDVILTLLWCDFVDVVENEVGVVFDSCGEDDYFVTL